MTVVGAGISGTACASALRDQDVPVRVLDRGHRPGGRMATRTVAGRVVDIGAAYFTAPPDQPGFRTVVDGWLASGRARPWTDTFAVADDDGIRDRTSGPMRYAAATGLRSLVADLAEGLDTVYEQNVAAAGRRLVDGEPVDETVLAMPDPQARRILARDEPVGAHLDEIPWEPIIAVVLEWDARRWAADLHGVFVNDSDDIGFIADDGDRRGDAAPVLVAHTTPRLASAHLEDPDGAVPAAIGAVRRVLGIRDDPRVAIAHRWTFARPSRARETPFAWANGVGVCGDGWGGKPSITTAWASGDALGRAIAAERT